MPEIPLEAYHPTERFSDRVKEYLRFRPHYPAEIIPFLRASVGLTAEDRIADIGSGTGFLAKLFLEQGSLVYGIEPNREMRRAGEQYLSAFGRSFVSIDGAAERTTLEPASVELAAAAQAFHWFDREKFRTECRRILTGKKIVLVVYNNRDATSTPFDRAYESLLRKFGGDEYERVRHRDASDENIGEFFMPGKWDEHTFPNAQVLDVEGVTGRILSSSYMPRENHPSFDAMVREIGEVVAACGSNGNVEMRYETKLYFGTLD